MIRFFSKLAQLESDQELKELNKSYWQPPQSEELANLFKMSSKLRTNDIELFKTASAGREILAIPEIVKGCIFYSLGRYHKSQGDYFTATADYFYSIFHTAVSIYKVHFDTTIVTKDEFNPTAITVKRKEITRFVDRLAKESLISINFRGTYESLQKRRDHVTYQPRIIMSGKEKNTITFFACQYGNLTSDIDEAEIRIPNLIFESAEMVGHILHYYSLGDPSNAITAPLYFKNWASVCLKTYMHWGAIVTSEIVGTELDWNSEFKYYISDKKRKAIIPELVIQPAEEMVGNCLEVLKNAFFDPSLKIK